MASKLQNKVIRWQDKCFGWKMRMNVRSAHAFIEEAIELAQACGLSEREVGMHVARIFAKPKGLVEQEIGGVMLTLASVANVYSLDMLKIMNDHVDWCEAHTDEIRDRYLVKEQNFLPAIE